MIDECQKLFKSNTDFWEKLKLGTQLRQNSRSLVLVMAAAYGLAASPYGLSSFQDLSVRNSSADGTIPAASSVNTAAQIFLSNATAAGFVSAESSSAAISQRQHISLSSPISTPFKRPANQVMTTTPIYRLEQCYPCRADGPMTLTLQRDEFDDLCSAWCSTYGIRLGAHVLQYIYFFSGGQVRK